MAKKRERVSEVRVDEGMFRLAEALNRAHVKYYELFGVPPHGTVKQFMAMLAMCPEAKVKESGVRLAALPLLPQPAAPVDEARVREWMDKWNSTRTCEQRLDDGSEFEMLRDFAKSFPPIC